ncbi:TNF superfamily member 30 [Latimeria chalumnae]|uniref:Tumor necrosis factor ligand superfamily member 6 n=1 Tax=Latimeria chalumnae TaxID=7897 RepID=H3A5U2_LATCH|nr:TNF superfamily member 30 [Latimeria chalumnae]|eukprot:XP_006012425.1 PREDICTED: tumor necrosis factor ligand superfamily member 6-like [Latimeria chalumnae]
MKQSSSRAGLALLTACLFLVLLTIASVSLVFFIQRKSSPDLEQGLQDVGHFYPSIKALRLLLTQPSARIHEPVRPVAHLTGKMPYDPKLERMQWEDEKGIAFIKNGLIYNNGRIMVLQDGEYFVYSQVYLRDHDCHSEVQTKGILHSVGRSRRGSQAEILMTKSNSCAVQKKLWFQTSYLAGTFPLFEGDELFVTISNTASVNYEEDKTYFGVFLL